MDREALQALVRQQPDQLLSRHAEIEQPHEAWQSREAEIQHLKLLILKLQRLNFGHKSEKLGRQIEQLELQLEELQTNRGESAPTTEPKSKPADDEAAAAPPPARTTTAPAQNLRTETEGLSRLRGGYEEGWRGRLGDVGLCARPVGGNPTRPA